MDGSAANRRIGPPRAGIAERIWAAARGEFSKRGYHGARVQGIARGASCNVALMYRHWASKRALYLDILRAVWLTTASEISRRTEGGEAGADSIAAAYLDAMMADPMGAQILIREYLDGAPYLSQLATADPSILEPVRRTAAALSTATDGGLDPVLALVTVGGLAALVASTREAALPFVDAPLHPDVWRRHVLALLVHGLSRRGDAPSTPAPAVDGSGNGAALR